MKTLKALLKGEVKSVRSTHIHNTKMQTLLRKIREQDHSAPRLAK
jgi:hypothetical protein